MTTITRTLNEFITAKTINAYLKTLRAKGESDLSTSCRKVFNSLKNKEADTLDNLLSMTTVPDEVMVEIGKMKHEVIEPAQPKFNVLKTIQNVTEVLGKEDSKLIRRVTLESRKLRKSARFGLEYELLLELARLANRPLLESDKWTEDAHLSAKELAIETMGVDACDIQEFADALEGVRISYGYNSFVELDENSIPIGICDGEEPDPDEALECYNTCANILGLPELEDISYSQSKYDKLEVKALARANEFLDEAEADRAKLEEMIA